MLDPDSPLGIEQRNGIFVRVVPGGQNIREFFAELHET